MLILTRRTGQTIKIGDDITITVLGARHMSVRLGIETPPAVTVRRGEHVDARPTPETEEQQP